MRGGGKSNKHPVLPVQQHEETKENSSEVGGGGYASSSSPNRKENKETTEQPKNKSFTKKSNNRSKLFLRQKTTGPPQSEEGATLLHKDKDNPKQKSLVEQVPEPCTSCGRNDLPERLHTHHSIESSTKKEVSKIPIRLDSPPKRIESLAEQQVISITRVKTSPTKRSRKQSLVKAYPATQDSNIEDSSGTKNKSDHLINLAGTVGSTMRNWMSPNQKRKHKKSRIKRSLSLEIKDLFMGFVNNGSSSSSTLSESKRKNLDHRSPSPSQPLEDVTPKRSTSFTSLIPSHVRSHTGRKTKSPTRPVSTTSLTTIKLVEFTSSTTDDEEDAECNITHIVKNQHKNKIEVAKRLDCNEDNVISSTKSSNSKDHTNVRDSKGDNSHKDKKVGEGIGNTGILNSLQGQEDKLKNADSERHKGFRFAKKVRKRWKHLNDDRDQVGLRNVCI